MNDRGLDSPDPPNGDPPRSEERDTPGSEKADASRLEQCERPPKRSEAPGSPEDQVTRPWESLLRLAAALGGLGGLVYIIGAATVWVRFRLVGLPADVALQHQSRSTVIALGLRGIGWVAVGLAALAGASYAIAWACWRVHAHMDHAGRSHEPGADGEPKADVRVGRGLLNQTSEQSVLDVAHGRICDWSPRHLRVLGFAVVVVVGFAATQSWQVFGVVTGVVIAGGAALRALRLRGEPGGGGMTTVLLLSMAGLVAGLTWQISAQIPVQAALVDPPPFAHVNVQRPLPYFGESSKYVYVGVVAPDGSGGYEYCHKITELARAKVRLTFVGGKVFLNRSSQTPAEILLHRGQILLRLLGVAADGTAAAVPSAAVPLAAPCGGSE